MDWNTYNQIHKLKKKLMKHDIKCALPNKQVSYKGKSCFKNTLENEFTVFQNRKGHKILHLSYLLIGKRHKIIMRVDFYGLSHDKIPTPHVHIFVPNKKEPYTTYPLKRLRGYDLSKNPKNSFINFLRYNNFVDTNKINFIDNQTGLFGKESD